MIRYTTTIHTLWDVFAAILVFINHDLLLPMCLLILVSVCYIYHIFCFLKLVHISAASALRGGQYFPETAAT